MQFEKVSKDAFASDMKRTYFSTYRGAEDIDFLIDKAYERIATPVRKTKRSAGYDFFIPVSVGLMPGEKCVVPSGIKLRFDDKDDCWHFNIYPRSGMGIKKGVIVSNGTGIIDADYYNNPDNEGDIMIALWNTSKSFQQIVSGTRCCQGIFEIHGLTADDNANGERMGGLGSTGL